MSFFIFFGQFCRRIQAVDVEIWCECSKDVDLMKKVGFWLRDVGLVKKVGFKM
jgi:hypothetical protein